MPIRCITVSRKNKGHTSYHIATAFALFSRGADEGKDYGKDKEERIRIIVFAIIFTLVSLSGRFPADLSGSTCG